MTNMSMMNHFQKTFLPILTGLLEHLWPPGDEHDYNALMEKAFCASITLWCTSEPNEQYDANLAEKISDYVFRLEKEEDAVAVTEAIRKARILAQKSILDAPYRIVNDFAEAADYMTAFAVDVNRRSVIFGIDSGGSKRHYAVFKMPHSDRIDFFYGKEDYILSVGDKMSYWGFFDRETGKLYDLREPMSMCWFHRPHGEVISESTGELNNAIKRALQNEVALRVKVNIPELPDVPPPDKLLALLKEVESDYSKGVEISDFADKVDIPNYYIQTNDPVRFIVEPEALIAERVDQYMERHGAEMERRWIFHLVAQQILTYTAELGGAVRNCESAGS